MLRRLPKVPRWDDDFEYYGRRLGGSELSSARLRHKDTGRIWISKAPAGDPDHALLSLYKELVGNRLYLLLGVHGQNQVLSKQRYRFEPKEAGHDAETAEIARIVVQELGRDSDIHLLSEMIEGFHTFGNYLDWSKSPVVDVQPRGKQAPVPVVGLGTVAMAAHWMADTDAFGGSGGNTGYIYQTGQDNEITSARAVKIDPGCAFSFETSPEIGEIKLAQVPPPVPFDAFHESMQREMDTTLLKIQVCDSKMLDDVFTIKGFDTALIEKFKQSTIGTLLERRTQLMAQFEARMRQSSDDCLLLARDALRDVYQTEQRDFMLGSKVNANEEYIHPLLLKNDKRRVKTGKQSKGAHQRDNSEEQSRKALTDSYESIRQAKEPTKLSLLMKEGTRVAVLGRAGSGKTMLLDHLCRKVWPNGASWLSQYQHVIKIKLRNLTAPHYPRGTPYDIYYVAARELQGVSLSMAECDRLKQLWHPATTLWLIDGYDERSNIPEYLREVVGAMLAQPHVIVTSRPGAGLTFDGPQYQLMGFTDQDVEAFVTKRFNQSQDEGQLLLRTLQSHAGLWQFAHIPITCSLLCVLSEHHKDLSTLTLTEVYQHMSRVLLKRYLRRRGVKDLQNMDDASYQGHVQKIEAVLAQLAYQGQEKGQIVFAEERVVSKFETHGLAAKDLDDNGVLRVHGVQCEYLHLSLQEYYAARYIAQRVIDGDTEPLKLYQQTARFRLVWWFVAGILASQPHASHLARFLARWHGGTHDLVGVDATCQQIRVLDEAMPRRRDIEGFQSYLDRLSANLCHLEAGHIVSQQLYATWYASLLKISPRLNGQVSLPVGALQQAMDHYRDSLKRDGFSVYDLQSVLPTYELLATLAGIPGWVEAEVLAALVDDLILNLEALKSRGEAWGSTNPISSTELTIFDDVIKPLAQAASNIPAVHLVRLITYLIEDLTHSRCSWHDHSYDRSILLVAWLRQRPFCLPQFVPVVMQKLVAKRAAIVGTLYGIVEGKQPDAVSSESSKSSGGGREGVRQGDSDSSQERLVKALGWTQKTMVELASLHTLSDDAPSALRVVYDECVALLESPRKDISDITLASFFQVFPFGQYPSLKSLYPSAIWDAYCYATHTHVRFNVLQALEMLAGVIDHQRAQKWLALLDRPGTLQSMRLRTLGAEHAAKMESEMEPSSEKEVEQRRKVLRILLNVLDPDIGHRMRKKLTLESIDKLRSKTLSFSDFDSACANLVHIGAMDLKAQDPKLPDRIASSLLMAMRSSDPRRRSKVYKILTWWNGFHEVSESIRHPIMTHVFVQSAKINQRASRLPRFDPEMDREISIFSTFLRVFEKWTTIPGLCSPADMGRMLRAIYPLLACGGEDKHRPYASLSDIPNHLLVLRNFREAASGTMVTFAKHAYLIAPKDRERFARELSDEARDYCLMSAGSACKALGELSNHARDFQPWNGTLILRGLMRVVVSTKHPYYRLLRKHAFRALQRWAEATLYVTPKAQSVVMDTLKWAMLHTDKMMFGHVCPPTLAAALGSWVKAAPTAASTRTRDKILRRAFYFLRSFDGENTAWHEYEPLMESVACFAQAHPALVDTILKDVADIIDEGGEEGRGWDVPLRSYAIVDEISFRMLQKGVALVKLIPFIFKHGRQDIRLKMVKERLAINCSSCDLTVNMGTRSFRESLTADSKALASLNPLFVPSFAQQGEKSK